MNILKKQGTGAWLLAVSFLLTIVSLIIYAVNSNGSYYSNAGYTVPLTIIGIVVAVAALVTGEFADRSIIVAKISDVLRIAFPILIMCAAAAFFSGRAESFAIIFFSDLEAGNEVAFSAATVAIVGIVFYLVASIMGAVSAYFKMKRAES